MAKKLNFHNMNETTRAYFDRIREVEFCTDGIRKELGKEKAKLVKKQEKLRDEIAGKEATTVTEQQAEIDQLTLDIQKIDNRRSGLTKFYKDTMYGTKEVPGLYEQLFMVGDETLYKSYEDAWLTYSFVKYRTACYDFLKDTCGLQRANKNLLRIVVNIMEHVVGADRQNGNNRLKGRLMPKLKNMNKFHETLFDAVLGYMLTRGSAELTNYTIDVWEPCVLWGENAVPTEMKACERTVEE